MKKSLAILTFVIYALLSCKKDTIQPNPNEKYYIHSNNNLNETIKITFSSDKKKIVNGHFALHGSSTDYPIHFEEIEFLDEFGFTGIATCEAWPDEVLFGLKKDFSEVGINDGKTLKKFFLQSR